MTRPIVFLGTDDAAAAALAALAAQGLVEAVVTPPERRRGRSSAAEPTVCGAAAAALGLRVLAVEDVNAEPVLAELRALAPRLMVVVSFGQFIRKATREIAPLGAVNLHYSLLPRWRGAAPVQRAILAGDGTTGASVQRVTAKLDAGAVIAAHEIAIDPRDDTPSLRLRLTGVGAPLLVDVVTRLLAGDAVHDHVQDESLVTLAPSIDRAEGDIDFAAEDAATIDRRIRALEPWPRCRARLVRRGGEPVDVFVRAAIAFPAAPDAAPGDVVSAGPEGIEVAARAGVLRITRLQRAGGKDMDVRAFLNGVPVAVGDRFERPSSAN
ncbi:MAG: methionyl-tRNA formyltransferase [Planctomycetes bacterium]|nr:methionyl-tRNA formyltransferase [Planctomycetota bacterium]